MAKTERKYRSEALRSVHLAMKGLEKVGAVDKATMRRFDTACLTPVEPFAPDDIKRTRERAHGRLRTGSLLEVVHAYVS